MSVTYTNTALATARRCLTEFDLRYEQQLDLDVEDRETLQVGHAWHRAFDVAHKGGDPFESIATHAPGELWAEKLGRLFAAHRWYWMREPLELEAAEETFRVELDGVTFEGQRDGRLRDNLGRVGVLERKTTSDSVEVGSAYWDRLRLDVQVGLYAVTMDPAPSFILYDVVRKPTINPKRLTKADLSRIRSDIAKQGASNYYQEVFTAEQLAGALEEERETSTMYGARLTADIGDRPAYYFARRAVDRTAQDYETLLANLTAQVHMIEHARANNLMHRNPDACNTFGRCTFAALCWNNIRPWKGDAPPAGFRRRDHLHPELQQ